MQEYTVKVKDHEQNITHTVHQLANSQNEANSIVIKALGEMLGHHNLTIV